MSREIPSEADFEAKLAFLGALGAVELVTKTNVADTGKYCLAPWTQVLTSDLRWVDAKSLEVGDTLAAFDEYPLEGHAGRRWRKATVLATKPVHQPTYRVSLSDGTLLTASGNHRWLVHRRGVAARWVHTEELVLGQALTRLTDVWFGDRSYEAGYLAGLYDGEGTLHQSPVSERRSGTHLSFGQNAGLVLDTALEMLDRLGYRYTVNETQDCRSVRLRGGRAEMMRFLGNVRPKRLLARLDYDRLGRLHPLDHPVVTGLEFLGEQELIATATDTETLIAEGLASHNTYTFADLGDVMNECKRVCEVFGLVFTQVPTVAEVAGQPMLAVGLWMLHKDGGEVQFDPLMMPLPKDAQAYGSALTYARRYQLMTVFRIAPEDDDGKAATVAAQAAPGRRTEAERMIRESIGQMEPDIRRQFVADFHEHFHATLADLPANRHGDALAWSRAWTPPLVERAADEMGMTPEQAAAKDAEANR